MQRHVGRRRVAERCLPLRTSGFMPPRARAHNHVTRQQLCCASHHQRCDGSANNGGHDTNVVRFFLRSRRLGKNKPPVSEMGSPAGTTSTCRQAAGSQASHVPALLRWIRHPHAKHGRGSSCPIAAVRQMRPWRQQQLTWARGTVERMYRTKHLPMSGCLGTRGSAQSTGAWRQHSSRRARERGRRVPDLRTERAAVSQPFAGAVRASGSVTCMWEGCRPASAGWWHASRHRGRQPGWVGVA